MADKVGSKCVLKTLHWRITRQGRMDNEQWGFDRTTHGTHDVIGNVIQACHGICRELSSSCDVHISVVLKKRNGTPTPILTLQKKQHCICAEMAAMYECLEVCCISLYICICMCSLYSNYMCVCSIVRR